MSFFANVRLSSGGVNDVGIYRGDGVTAPVQIARYGQAVPGGTGTISMFGRQTMNQAGQVAVTANIDLANGGGAYDEYSIIRGDGTPGSLTVIARTGQPVPGGNGVFASFGHPALNQSGQLAFRAHISGSSGGFRDNLGLFFYDSSLGVIMVARIGSTFLGSTLTAFDFINTGGYITDGRTGFNDSGEVAYQFELADGREGVARFSLIESPSTPFAITKIQVNPGLRQLALEWRTSSNATAFTIRYSDTLILPRSEWPALASSLLRQDPVNRFETTFPFPLPPSLFFFVEEE